MRGALDEWRRALAALEPRSLRCAFVANRTGEIGDGDGDGNGNGNGNEDGNGNGNEDGNGNGNEDGNGNGNGNEDGHGNAVGPDIPSLLAEQLTHPVQWWRALATVRAHADIVVTIGPGAVLRALWHRCFERGSEIRDAQGGPLPEPAKPAIWEGRARAEAAKQASTRPGVGIPADSIPTDTIPTGTKPRNTKLLATDDERSLGETIAYLRGLE